MSEPPDDTNNPAEDRVVRARVRRQQALDEEEIPRVPRGKGLRFASGHLIRIGFTVAILVLLIVVQRSCADRVSNFVVDFDQPGSGSSIAPHPSTLELGPVIDPAQRPHGSTDDYEVLGPNATEAEIAAAVERARARARANQPDAGSRTGSGAGSPP